MKCIYKLISFLIVLEPAVGAAAQVTVVQAGQTFLTDKAEATAAQIKENPALGKEFVLKKLTLKKGDTINFKNMDKVTHNVYAKDFDLKAQAPGDQREQVFAHEGTMSVNCAIHPKMKFEVIVEK